MTVEALRTYEELMAAPDSLLALHPSVASGSSGRPSGDQRPLLISAYILQHTAFENFIELTVRAYMEARFERAASVSDLPSYFADYFVEERIRIDYRRAHAFLGERFYDEALNKAEERIAKFNTPNFDKANRLFADLVDFQNVVGRSTWQGMGPDRLEEKLDKFVFRRGELVHTGTSEQDLYLRDIRENRTFLDSLTRAIAQTAESDWRALCADKRWPGTTP